MLGNEGQELKFVTFDEMKSLPLARYLAKYIAMSEKGLKKLIETGEADKTSLGFDENDVVYI